MIAGGWEYIAAAYGLTWVVLGLYAMSLWARDRRLRAREKETS